MAGNTDVRTLVDRFVNELETMVQRRVNAEFASRFDELRHAILSGEATVPVTRSGAVRGKPGPKSGYTAELKACPVCGEMNKARRFSYLCEDHRSAENLAKFKGGGADAAAPDAGGSPKAGRSAKRVTGARSAAKSAAEPASTAPPRTP